jgi:hypothetical protein
LLGAFESRRDAFRSPGQYLRVSDAESLDPPLLPQGERDKETELDQFGD